ncbi:MULTISPECIES: hypothetical protein [Nostocales]|uniref:Uncharacterized protein n=3 Tax=Nostocales TaxID=1161 RepID=A0A0C1NHD6_9CYAN|nr:hypothetical protein [Tolypothrix bouteillei]KAF3890418.1 hypothetical protein DA73_0400036945 [Tolypothrix bouteillei VB521301]
MIRTLVESAFQTGCLSVESEGLLYQVLTARSYQSKDLIALSALYDAVRVGQIKRESSSRKAMPLEFLVYNPVG